MTSPHLATLSTLALLLAGGTAVAGEDEQAVRCAEVSFSLAAEARDPKAFRAHIDPDARFVGTGVARGPDEILQAWAAFFTPDGPRIAWRPRIVEVLQSGDYALTRGPYRIETRDEDGQTAVGWGTFNSVWRRGSDGQWRVVFDAGGPANERPTEESQGLLQATPDECVAPGDR